MRTHGPARQAVSPRWPREPTPRDGSRSASTSCRAPWGPARRARGSWGPVASSAATGKEFPTWSRTSSGKRVAPAALARELETSQLVERGSQKLLDRLEGLARDERAAREALEQREKRLILCLGGLQRENELLRERLALAGARGAAGDRGRRRSRGGRASPSGATRRRRARATRSAAPGWLARIFRR